MELIAGAPSPHTQVDTALSDGPDDDDDDVVLGIPLASYPSYINEDQLQCADRS